MQITKTFRVEGSHIVRNCTSKRCSHSIHGHSYLIEVELESDVLDNAQMVCDFGLLKGPVKEYIDSMDHCHLICSKDNPEYVEFSKKYCDRYISIPFNPSAEMISIWIFDAVNRIINHTNWNNGEKYIKVSSITVWETTTGRAKCSSKDYYNYKEVVDFNNIEYSRGVMDDWSGDLRTLINTNASYQIQNPVVKQQISL